MTIIVPFGGILSRMRWNLPIVYLYVKFEVSCFTHSRFTERGLKFKILTLDLDHAPFGGILSRMRWDLHRSIRIPNLKFLASPVPKIRRSAVKWLMREGVYPN